MKKTLFIFLFLALVSFKNVDFEWKTYVFKKSNFKMSFPQKPSVQSEDNNINIRTESNGIVYNVSVTINNKFNLKLASSLLKESQKGIIQKNDKIIKSTRTSYKGYPMKELRIKSEDGMSIIYRTIITKDKMYQLAIAHYGKFPSETTENKFFNSFNFLTK